MAEEQTWTELVKLAQQGHGDSVDLLAQKAQGRLCAYVYRVTLDYELTEDLSQEVLLQMVKSLDGHRGYLVLHMKYTSGQTKKPYATLIQVRLSIKAAET